jgi:hypothetical protein
MLFHVGPGPEMANCRPWARDGEKRNFYPQLKFRMMSTFGNAAGMMEAESSEQAAQFESIVFIKSLDTISPGTSNSDEDLLSNCSTESAGESIITRKTVVIAPREGCAQCSNFANMGCPKCSPSSRRNMQRRLQHSPAIGVAVSELQPTCAQHNMGSHAKKSTGGFQAAKFRSVKDLRTYRPELWEVSRAV